MNLLSAAFLAILLSLSAARPDDLPVIPISEQKCDEYRYPCQESAIPLVGRTYAHLVAIGWVSEDEEMPRWVCAGNLISENYVVTAAHCTTYPRGNGEENFVLKVRLGQINAASKAGRQIIDVARITKHVEYKPGSIYHDIALLKLAKNVEITDKVRPICLHNRPEVPENELTTAIGWGRPEQGNSNIIEEAPMELVNQTACKQEYPPMRRLADGITENLICAKTTGEEKDICQGDSGAPLYYKDSQCAYRLLGVSSFGRGCGASAPGVYTRISAYVDWIEANVWPKN